VRGVRRRFDGGGMMLHKYIFHPQQERERAKGNYALIYYIFRGFFVMDEIRLAFLYALFVLLETPL